MSWWGWNPSNCWSPPASPGRSCLPSSNPSRNRSGVKRGHIGADRRTFGVKSVRWILSILPHRFCAVLWLHIERRNDKAKSGRESLWASYDTQAAWDMTITFRCHCWLLDKLCHDCWECCWTGSLTRSRYQSMVFGNLLSHGQSAQPMAYKLCSTAAAISFVQVIQ